VSGNLIFSSHPLPRVTYPAGLCVTPAGVRVLLLLRLLGVLLLLLLLAFMLCFCSLRLLSPIRSI
jgi:hypothetical protein